MAKKNAPSTDSVTAEKVEKTVLTKEQRVALMQLRAQKAQERANKLAEKANKAVSKQRKQDYGNRLKVITAFQKAANKEATLKTDLELQSAKVVELLDVCTSEGCFDENGAIDPVLQEMLDEQAVAKAAKNQKEEPELPLEGSGEAEQAANTEATEAAGE